MYIDKADCRAFLHTSYVLGTTYSRLIPHRLARGCFQILQERTSPQESRLISINLITTIV